MNEGLGCKLDSWTWRGAFVLLQWDPRVARFVLSEARDASASGARSSDDLLPTGGG